MKRILVVCVILFCSKGFSQNTFPNSGNVGIGTASPQGPLHIEAGNGGHFMFTNGISTKWDGGAYSDNSFRINHQGVGARLIIDNSGNIGVGTTSPLSKLEVFGNPLGGTNFRATGGNARLIVDYQSLGQNYYDGSFHIFRNFAGTERMRINGATGNIGIGTDSPSRLLEVNGESRMQTLNLTSSGNNSWSMGTTPNNFFLYNNTTGQNPFTVLNNGNVGIGTTNPITKLDIRGGLGVGIASNGENALKITSTNVSGQNHQHIFEGSTNGTNDEVIWSLSKGGGAYGGFDLRFSNISRFYIGGNNLTPNSWINPYGNFGIGTTTPQSKLEINSDIVGKAGLRFTKLNSNSNAVVSNGKTLSVDSNGDVILVNSGVSDNTLPSSNRTIVGLEKNMLLNAKSRFTITQTGVAKLDENIIFDGAFAPSYTNVGIPQGDSTVVLIENLPDAHTQAGVLIGWTTRYWWPSKFKIEGFNNYGVSGWVVIANVSNNTNSEYFIKPPGGQYTKLKYTFYTAVGEGGRLGISELIYHHPEYVKAYDGLMVQYNASGNVGIGTNSPTEKLTVYGENNSKPGTILLHSSREDAQNVAVGSIKAMNGNGEIARIDLNREGGSSTGYLSFFTKATNSTPVFEAMRIGANGNVGIGTTLLYQKFTVNGGIGFDFNSADKKLYSPEDGTLEWMTNDLAISKGFAVSHQGQKRVFLSTSGDSYLNGGNVGIGTITPGYKLDVAGTGLVTSRVRSTDNQANITLQGQFGQLQNTVGDFYITNSSVSSSMILRTGNSLERMRINSSGQVVVGIPTVAVPYSYLFAVAGNMITEKIKVRKQSSGWADFVFDDDYKLPTLESVEQYIKKNKHLPEIPSAAEVEKDGQDLGEMNKLLLQKVEELTLYMIEMKKENATLKKRMDMLEK